MADADPTQQRMQKLEGAVKKLKAVNDKAAKKLEDQKDKYQKALDKSKMALEKEQDNVKKGEDQLTLKEQQTKDQLENQKFKIKKSLKIFHQNDLDPKVWVAPAHSFDSSTLKAISEETNIKIISDGISTFQYFNSGFHFIPQQLWSIKKKTFGLWTVCLHPDTMSDEEINEFERQLSSSSIYKSSISIEDIVLTKNNKKMLDYCYSALFFTRFFVSSIYRNCNK